MRLTILALAGLALSMAAPAVHAADLPPAPVLDDSDDPPATGWYLRADSGVGPLMVRHGHDGGVASLPPLAKARLGRDALLGGGIGYRFGSWLRTDLTIDWRSGAAYRGTRLDGGSGSAADRADFEAATVLANLYVDLPLWSGVTPYVGAGIGVSRNRFGDAGRAAAGAASAALPPHAASDLAWALMSGITVDLTSHVSLDLGYRYAHLGSARTGLGLAAPPVRARDIDAHEFRIGARYTFN